MQLVCGIIKEVTDDKIYEIIATIPQGGEVKARQVRCENEPLKGDEVLLIMLDDFFNGMNLYVPLNILTKDDFRGIARKGYKVEWLYEGGIVVTDKSTTITFKDDTLNYDNGTTKVEIAGGNITVTASMTDLTNTAMTHKGSAVPSGTGPFCAVPFCMFSGSPHSGEVVNKG